MLCHLSTTRPTTSDLQFTPKRKTPVCSKPSPQVFFRFFFPQIIILHHYFQNLNLFRLLKVRSQLGYQLLTTSIRRHFKRGFSARCNLSTVILKYGSIQWSTCPLQFCRTAWISFGAGSISLSSKFLSAMIYQKSRWKGRKRNSNNSHQWRKNGKPVSRRKFLFWSKYSLMKSYSTDFAGSLVCYN